MIPRPPDGRADKRLEVVDAKSDDDFASEKDDVRAATRGRHHLPVCAHLRRTLVGRLHVIRYADEADPLAAADGRAPILVGAEQPEPQAFLPQVELPVCLIDRLPAGAARRLPSVGILHGRSAGDAVGNSPQHPRHAQVITADAAVRRLEDRNGVHFV